MEILGFSRRLEEALEYGELKLRPIHGDPKISNIMIDEIIGKGLDIVYLNAVNPGLISMILQIARAPFVIPLVRKCGILTTCTLIRTSLKCCGRLSKTGEKISRRSGPKISLQSDSPYSLRVGIKSLCGLFGRRRVFQN